MKIALCDDEKSYHGKILELIGQYRETKPGCTLLMSSFYSGKDLLNHVDEYGGFDLYILDCIMPGMDGIELGAALRRRDDHGMLIYLTSSPDFALDSYRVDAFDYLLKPVDKELFFRIRKMILSSNSMVFPAAQPESGPLFPDGIMGASRYGYMKFTGQKHLRFCNLGDMGQVNNERSPDKEHPFI